jgi:hypothetical protein
MRETRTSGSVEGVLSNGHPYSDSIRRGFWHLEETPAFDWLCPQLSIPIETCQGGNSAALPNYRDRFTLFYDRLTPARWRVSLLRAHAPHRA